MKKLLNIITLCVLITTLSGCAGGIIEKRSKEGYQKSPCACFDEILFINGQVFKVERS